MEMKNLLDETMADLTDNGRTPADVAFVLLPWEKMCTWEEFAKAANFEYDADYGREYVQDVYIVGDGWWMERRGNDTGAEWWAFKQAPKPAEEFSEGIDTVDIMGKRNYLAWMEDKLGDRK